MKDHKSPFRLLSKKKRARDADVSTASADSKLLASSAQSAQQHVASLSPDSTPEAIPQLDGTPNLKYENGRETPLLRIRDEEDHSTILWRRFCLSQSPFPRYRHAASLISTEQDDVFVMGGLKDGLVFGDTWKVAPGVDTLGNLTGYGAKMIDVANLNNPPARVGHAAVLCGNAFIVYGGDTVDTDFNGFPDNNFYLFNTSNCKYTIPSHILNKPNGRYGHKIAVVLLAATSLRLYLFGGQLEDLVFNELYYFELNSFKSPQASWILADPVNNFKPPAVTNHSMLVYKNSLYVFGGVYNNERVSNDLWCFMPSENKWLQVTTKGTLPPPVNEHAACVVNDHLYVYGGNDFNGTIFGTLHVLDFPSLTWHEIESGQEGPGARCGHSLTFLPRHNKVLIMGGNRNDYVVDSDFTGTDAFANNKGAEMGTYIYELDVGAVTRSLHEESSEKPVLVSVSPSGRAKLVQTSSADSNQNQEAIGGLEIHNSESLAREPASPDSKSRDDHLVSDLKNIDSKLPLENVDSKLQNGHISPPLPPKTQPPQGSNFGGDPDTFKTPIASPNTPMSKTFSSMQSKESNSAELKNLIMALKQELEQLKVSAVKQMEIASTKIHLMQLEQEDSLKAAARDKKALESQLYAQKADFDAGSSRGVENDPVEESVWSTYTLQNQVNYLSAQNKQLHLQLAEVRPFMEKQVNEAGQLEQLFAKQEEQHALLTSRLIDQQELKAEAAEWKAKYQRAQEEHDNLKTINLDLETNMASRRLAQLASSWQAASDHILSKSTGDSPGALESLHKQVEDLIAAGKNSELLSKQEILELKAVVDSKDAAIKIHESNYREALQSVKSTSRALKINEDAMTSQKTLLEKLAKENNELRLYKKARQGTSRLSSRNALPILAGAPANNVQSPEARPVPENVNSSDNDSDDDDVSRAHYNMRLKDLEADAYILRKERDLLKSKVAELEKQQYLMQADSEE